VRIELNRHRRHHN